jgi:two-component system, LuxR family, sensor histidine kinase DctS
MDKKYPVGYSEAELIGRAPPMPYWVSEELERTQRLNDAVLAGESTGQGLEVKFQRGDGTRFDVLIYEAPLVDDRGNIDV